MAGNSKYFDNGGKFKIILKWQKIQNNFKMARISKYLKMAGNSKSFF
jgi:hypothetical protein